MSHMGFSVRVANARYTEWRIWKPNCVGDWTAAGLVAQELYDHTGDMGYDVELGGGARMTENVDCEKGCCLASIV